LRRTRVGIFSVVGAITLDDLKVRSGEEALGTVLVTPSMALSKLPFVHLSSDDVRKARHGMAIVASDSQWSDGDNIGICDEEGDLIAVGRYDANNKQLQPRVVISPQQ
jgi:tRNA U55 pseudouridine synthase TruB